MNLERLSLVSDYSGINAEQMGAEIANGSYEAIIFSDLSFEQYESLMQFVADIDPAMLAGMEADIPDVVRPRENCIQVRFE